MRQKRASQVTEPRVCVCACVRGCVCVCVCGGGLYALSIPQGMFLQALAASVLDHHSRHVAHHIEMHAFLIVSERSNHAGMQRGREKDGEGDDSVREYACLSDRFDCVCVCMSVGGRVCAIGTRTSVAVMCYYSHGLLSTQTRREYSVPLVVLSNFNQRTYARAWVRSSVSSSFARMTRWRCVSRVST